jgi:thymidylate kinase
VAKATHDAHIDIDQLDDSIFRWPDDLLKPEAVFILCVDESKRNDRVDKRLKDTTLDSTSIERDESMKVLGSRVMEAFHKIRANNVDIDANHSMEEVKNSVWSHLKLSLTRLYTAD